jgi:hypothetical protein
VRSGEKVLVMLNTSDKNNGLKPFVIVSGSLALSPVIVVDTGGNVGVGTNTVQAKFNVYGDSSLVNALVKVNSNIATNALFISSSGKVGINTDVIGDYNLCVSGSFSATTKSFLIDHQKQQGKKLQYGVLEGPEHAVFYRGKLKHKHNIELPEDWEWLVDQDTITVHLTAVHPTKTPSILRIENNIVHLAGAENDIDCHFIIHAERKDVPKIKTVI